MNSTNLCNDVGSLKDRIILSMPYVHAKAVKFLWLVDNSVVEYAILGLLYSKVFANEYLTKNKYISKFSYTIAILLHKIKANSYQHPFIQTK